MLRIVLDVNLWVAGFIATARGRYGTSSQSLVTSAIAGQCRLGSLVSCLSFPMLDALQYVLEGDFGIPPHLADSARSFAETAGSQPLPPLAVLGGGVLPLADVEDLDVLETALAARADMLVTGNMRDFVPGPRARIDAEIVRTALGAADVLLVRHARVPQGLVITTPYAAKAWLIDGVLPPAGVLERFWAGRDEA